MLIKYSLNLSLYVLTGATDGGWLGVVLESKTQPSLGYSWAVKILYFTTKQELNVSGKNSIIQEILGRAPSILEARAALFACWRVTETRLHKWEIQKWIS